MATQEDLILQQFAGARKNLNTQKTQAKDQLAMDLNRQNAITGASGGRQLKAQAKASKGLEQAFGTAGAELDSQQAGQMRETQAQKDQQAYQTSEAKRGEGIQQAQFGKSFGLQQKQFDESKSQFQKQMGFQMKEFDENQRTNLINAMTAFEKSGLGNPDRFNQLMNSVNRIRGRI